jgi:hypothetical protein
MKKTVKILREHIDAHGEMSSTERIIEQVYPSEPNFIKFYVDRLEDLFKISNTAKNVLMSLLKLTNYDNIVDLPNGKRKLIMETVDISYAQLDNGLRELIKNNVISKQATGVYIINPNYFGKGAWRNVYEVRVETIINKNGCFNVIEIKSKENKQ